VSIVISPLIRLLPSGAHYRIISGATVKRKVTARTQKVLRLRKGEGDNQRMARIVLVLGEPDNGKSTLATKLQQQHQCSVVEVDTVYVEWVEKHVPELYFPFVGKYIFQHYHYLLMGEYSAVKVFKRNLVAEWRAHLIDFIKKESSQHEALVVEGYLLGDNPDGYEQALATPSTQVFQIYVKEYQYYLKQPPPTPPTQVTPAQIAALGLTT
jgi:hypothetical protein